MSETAAAPAPTSVPTPAAPTATTGGAAPPAPGADGATEFRMPSLWVGDLAPDVGEALLYHIFSAIAPVSSIRVCRDQVTRLSLGYAYVNFHTVEQAEAAMRAMNYEDINGRRCRIMWSQRDPSRRKAGVGNIFIKNLDESVDSKALHDTFARFGAIVSCKVATDPDTGRSKCYGYVQFEKDADAQKAIEKVNGMLIADKSVSVSRYIRRADRAQNGVWTNCYVKHIPLSWTDENLRELFEQHGEVTSAVVMRNAAGVSRGFGFVNFATKEQAEAAREALDGYVTDESKPDGESKAEGESKTESDDKKLPALYVSRAQTKTERRRLLQQQFRGEQSDPTKSQGTNLYLKNLAEDVVDDDLLKDFAPFGTITSARVMRNQDNSSRGFGFVCFSSPEEATRAVNEMNKKLWHGRPLYVALHQRRALRDRQLKEEMEMRMAQGQVGGMPRMGVPAPFMMGPGGPQMATGAPPGGAYPQTSFMNYMPPTAMMGARGMGMMGGMMPMNGMAPMGMGFSAASSGGAGSRGGSGVGYQSGGRGSRRGPRSSRRGGAGGMSPAGGMGPFSGHPSAGAPPHHHPAAEMPAPHTRSWTESLATADPQARTDILGEKLFPLVERRNPQMAGKITGMLLELDTQELINLIESPEQLDLKVNEAMDVLSKHHES